MLHWQELSKHRISEIDWVSLPALQVNIRLHFICHNHNSLDSDGFFLRWKCWRESSKPRWEWIQTPFNIAACIFGRWGELQNSTSNIMPNQFLRHSNFNTAFQRHMNCFESNSYLITNIRSIGYKCRICSRLVSPTLTFPSLLVSSIFEVIYSFGLFLLFLCTQKTNWISASYDDVQNASAII